MKIGLRRLAFFAYAVVFAHCTQANPDTAWLVRVDGYSIPVEVYRQRLKLAQKEIGDIPALNREGLLELKQRILAEIVAEHLLSIEADRRGIKISPEELAAEIARLRLETPERDWRSYLLEHYVDDRNWQQKLEQRLKIDVLVNLEVEREQPITEVEIAKFFEEVSQETTTGVEIKLSQVVVNDPILAANLRKRIVAGEDFAEIAKANSIGVEAQFGGALGYVRAGDLPESFEPAFQLRIGELSKVVETEFGFHIFRVESIRTGYLPTYDTLRDAIAATLHRERAEQMRAELTSRLRDAAKVEINQAAWAAIISEGAS